MLLEGDAYDHDTQEIETEVPKKTQLYAGGGDGEAFVRRWLRTNNWTRDEIDQTPENFCDALKACGDKRPDCVADADTEYFLLLDAKCHTIAGSTRFALRVD